MFNFISEMFSIEASYIGISSNLSYRFRCFDFVRWQCIFGVEFCAEQLFFLYIRILAVAFSYLKAQVSVIMKRDNISDIDDVVQ